MLFLGLADLAENRVGRGTGRYELWVRGDFAAADIFFMLEINLVDRLGRVMSAH